VDDLWAAVQALVATCAGGGAKGEMAAQRFVKTLKMTFISAGKQYADETDADKLAVLLWSATERSTDDREFCSYLNQCLRADKDPPLRHAAVFACQLNKSLVGNFGGRAKAAGLDKGTWPCGPDAEFGISTKANATWRGTALPSKHLGFFTVGQQFRTNMFLATSFDRDVAERFMTMQYSENPQDGRALWEFQFEEKNCCHVNFIGDGSAVQDEKEFLLTPYTALKVKSFEPSPDLEVQPHRIVVSVAPDNKVPREDLPLAPWG